MESKSISLKQLSERGFILADGELEGGNDPKALDAGDYARVIDCFGHDVYRSVNPFDVSDFSRFHSLFNPQNKSLPEPESSLLSTDENKLIRGRNFILAIPRTAEESKDKSGFQVYSWQIKNQEHKVTLIKNGEQTLAKLQVSLNGRIIRQAKINLTTMSDKKLMTTQWYFSDLNGHIKITDQPWAAQKKGLLDKVVPQITFGGQTINWMPDASKRLSFAPSLWDDFIASLDEFIVSNRDVKLNSVDARLSLGKKNLALVTSANQESMELHAVFSLDLNDVRKLLMGGILLSNWKSMIPQVNTVIHAGTQIMLTLMAKEENSGCLANIVKSMQDESPKVIGLACGSKASDIYILPYREQYNRSHVLTHEVGHAIMAQLEKPQMDLLHECLNKYVNWALKKAGVPATTINIVEMLRRSPVLSFEPDTGESKYFYDLYDQYKLKNYFPTAYSMVNNHELFAELVANDFPWNQVVNPENTYNVFYEARKKAASPLDMVTQFSNAVANLTQN